jgi:hypothetical protein
MGLEEILRYFPYIILCENGFLYCSPTLPLVAMILTNLILDYVRKLPCKFELFWLSGS